MTTPTGASATLREDFGKAIDMHLAFCDEPQIDSCATCRRGMEAVDSALRELRRLGYVLVRHDGCEAGDCLACVSARTDSATGGTP